MSAPAEPAPIEEFEVLDLLAALIEKSLVVVDEETGRYRLLETVRQYGLERLATTAEAGNTRSLH